MFIIIVILNSLWPVFILVKIILSNVLNTGQSIIFFQLIRRVSFPVRAAVSLHPFYLHHHLDWAQEVHPGDDEEEVPEVWQSRSLPIVVVAPVLLKNHPSPELF